MACRRGYSIRNGGHRGLSYARWLVHAQASSYSEHLLDEASNKTALVRKIPPIDYLKSSEKPGISSDRIVMESPVLAS